MILAYSNLWLHTEVVVSGEDNWVARGEDTLLNL